MKKLTGAVQIIFGLLFAMNMPTDIQFGFAVVLITMGLVNVFDKK